MNEPKKKHLHHHHHHQKQAHSETLSDGTVIKKFKKEKKILRDGSSVVKSVTKTIPPKCSSIEQSSKDQLLKTTKTKTRQTHRDGISHTTTIVEEIISRPSKSNSEILPHKYEQHTSHLRDGTAVVTTKEVTLLSDGNVSTVITKVHDVKAELPTQNVEVEEVLSESNFGTDGLNLSLETFDESHGASLETFDINDDRAPMPIQYIEDSKDISSKGCSSFNKNLEIIESDSNAPLSFEYCPAVGSVMNERRYAMLKTKHAAMQSTAGAIQCGTDNDDR